MGVGPAGAQVRRRVGMSSKPLASRKARWAPRRRAFFDRGPLGAFPLGHGLFVAVDGRSLRHLATPAQATPDCPDMGGMRAPPKLDLNHGRDALASPQLVGDAMGPGPREPPVPPLRARLVCQPARPPGRRLGGQGRLAPALPGLSPLRHGADRRLDPACDRAPAQPVLQKRPRAASPSFSPLG